MRWSLCGVLMLAACATSNAPHAGPDVVHPAPGVSELPTRSSGAVATHAGVRLELRTDVAHPRKLEASVLPLFVRIHNGTQRHVLVRPRFFYLISDTGEQRQAIPPTRLSQPGESLEPSEVAVAMAGLADNVLTAGAETQGFLYFEPFDVAGPLALTFELWPETGTESMGLITIPLTTLPKR